MPDLAMCNNDKCKRKLQCYRFMAIPNRYRQSWSYFAHYECHAFLPIEGRRIKSEHEAGSGEDMRLREGSHDRVWSVGK